MTVFYSDAERRAFWLGFFANLAAFVVIAIIFGARRGR